MSRLTGVAVFALVLATTACADGDDQVPVAASPAPPVTASPNVPPPTVSPPSRPSSTPTALPPRPPVPASTIPRPPPSRPSSTRTLVGAVERGELCPLLRVGKARWVLAGPLAQQLAPGAQVEVTGYPEPSPRGCPGGRALRVTSVRPR